MSLEYIQIFLKVSNDKFQWLEHDHQAKMFKNTEMNFMLCNYTREVLWYCSIVIIVINQNIIMEKNYPKRINKCGVELICSKLIFAELIFADCAQINSVTKFSSDINKALDAGKLPQKYKFLCN